MGAEGPGAEIIRRFGAPRGSFTLPIRGKLKSANVIIVLQVGLSAYSRHLSYMAISVLHQ